MSYDGSSAKSYIRHATEKERLDNLAFASFPEDYLPYAAAPGHQRTSAPPPYLLWGDDRRRRPSKKRRKPKCAGALLCAIALVVVAILAVVAISVYLGVVTNLFRSPVVSVSGRFLASEEFSEELLNSSSTKFLEKADVYQSKVEKAFLSSSLEPAFIAARIYSFRPGLVVFFRVYLDRRKIKQDSGGESPPTELVRELVAQKLTADPESVHIEENEELLSVELRPIEINHLPVSSTLKPTTQRNGHQRPPASGGVGEWRPVPIEDSVSPSFAERPIIGVGSARSPEEIPRRNTAEGFGSARVLEDTSGKNPQSSDINREGIGSVRILEEVRNPQLNVREGTGPVRLLEEPTLQNSQSHPKNEPSNSRDSHRKPSLPIDRGEGVGSVRLLPESPIEASKITNLQQGLGSIRFTDTNTRTAPKLPANLGNSGSVRPIDGGSEKHVKIPEDAQKDGLVQTRNNNPNKKLPSHANPFTEGFLRTMEDPPTLAPSVLLVVRNRSRSDKTRNLLSRLDNGHQNTDLARSENVGLGFIKEIITEEEFPLPLLKEPPIISSRLLDLVPETTIKINLSTQAVTEIAESEEKLKINKTDFQNISTEMFLAVEQNKEHNKTESLILDVYHSNNNSSKNITFTTEVPANTTLVKETLFQSLKDTLENILFNHPTQTSLVTTETEQNDLTVNPSTKSINLNDNLNITINEMSTVNDAIGENNYSTQILTAETIISNDTNVFIKNENISSTTKESNEDVRSSIVNYSQYLFSEPHFHTIQNDTNTSEDSYEVHTFVGHGFHKPSNTNSSTTDMFSQSLTTEFSVIPSLITSDESHTSNQSTEVLEAFSVLNVVNRNESSIQYPPEVNDNITSVTEEGATVENDIEVKTPGQHSDTFHDTEKILTDIETEVTEIYGINSHTSEKTTHATESKVTEILNISSTNEEILTHVETVNETIDDTSQQAKIVPQMQTDLLSNDIGEGESGDENSQFEDEILRHITTARPKFNGSAIMQSCPTDSVPCDVSGEGCGIRCDMRKDCLNNEDEMGCMCSDLLRAMGQSQKICDGVDDCSDKSDEANCPWCPSTDHFRCPGSRICVTMNRVCDGKDDCPGAQDERRCVNLAESSAEAELYNYRSEGYLIVRKNGQWGKLCLDALTHSPDLEQRINDLGKAVCSALTYKNMSSSVHGRDKFEFENSYYQISTGTADNKSSTSLFEPTSCKGKEVLRVQCKTLECGLRPSAPPSQRRRIVGGRSADSAGSWPWAAALYREGDFQCGAALISDMWLVSAAHCFFSSQQAYWTARLGVLRRGSELPTNGEQVRRISNIVLHPQYEDAGFINDIAVLRMDQAVSFSDTLRPICLPSSPTEDASLWHGRRCSVVGWGKLYEIGHTFPDSLQEVRLPVISSTECQKRSIFLPAYRITPNMFCAGYDRGGRDACLGDSGGPMACQRPADGRWILLGITSNGDGCGRPGRPGVYSQVAGFLSWIQDMISEEKVVEGNTGLESTCSRGVRCRLGRCIQQTRVCDGRRDCAGGEDEISC